MTDRTDSPPPIKRDGEGPGVPRRALLQMAAATPLMPSPATAEEAAIDPGVPFIDAHHHLWAKSSPGLLRLSGHDRFLIDDLMAVAAGSRLAASVYVDAESCHRALGPPPLRPVGETEFAVGQAAIAESRQFGTALIAAAIVGTADLTLGAGVGAVLDAHIQAGNGRFRGIRVTAAWDADRSIVGGIMETPAGLYGTAAFRAGFAELAPRGLSFEAFVLAPQLPDVTALARAFPDTRIVLNHVGNPVGIGVHKGHLQEQFAPWRRDIIALAALPNVFIKLGGLGTFLTGFPAYGALPPFSSAQIAAEWRPYLETAITAFGADRAMFESNYPVDARTGSYRTILNAFARIAAGCSLAQKTALFGGTAAAFYRIKNTG